MNEQKKQHENQIKYNEEVDENDGKKKEFSRSFYSIEFIHPRALP